MLSSCLVLLLTSGCAHRSYVAPDYAARKPSRVAVLPVVNLSGASLRAPTTSTLALAFRRTAIVATYARRLVANRFSTKGYRVLDLAETDRRLAAAAARGPVTPDRLDAVLGVDAVAEVRVTEWDASLLTVSRELQIGLDVELSTIGTTLFHGSSRGARAIIHGPGGISFRPHMVEAIDDALRGLP